MPDSFVTAKKRLIGIKRRLQRDHVLKQKYCEQMNIALANDYAEVVLDEQIDESHRVWCIPHHPVLNLRKPEKVRVVYDCAARSNHVPSEINPADLISRGTRGNDLVDKRIWFEGPEFLKFPPERWPKCFSKEIDDDEAMLESFATGKGNVSLLACVGAGDGVNRLIDYFSSF